MTMICRITDETINNPWDTIHTGREQLKSIHDTTIADIMGEDLTMHIQRNREFGFDLSIEDENGNEFIDEKSIHPFAMDSMADFCRRFLYNYEKLTKERDE